MINQNRLFTALGFLAFFSVFTSGCSETKNTSCIDDEKINPDQVCIQIYAPVCGCNGETYANECKAEAAGVTKWTDGPCEDPSNE